MELKFETDRLVCFPTSLRDFFNALNNSEQFIKKYSSPFPKSPYGGVENFKKIGELVYEKAIKDEKKYFWYTPWIIELKENNEIIGIINFKGSMTAKDEIAIGYGIEPQYRNEGYASEIVKGAIHWVKDVHNVKRIFAFTAKNNLKSHKVLKKNEFVPYDEINEEIKWKYEIQEM
ncbi:MAG: GNAT family N-acetyltransferase [Candidatus Hodarchaeales archaeon]|jgi:RimJ/RimL family protein N-acetyltransferase